MYYIYVLYICIIYMYYIYDIWQILLNCRIEIINSPENSWMIPRNLAIIQIYKWMRFRVLIYWRYLPFFLRLGKDFVKAMWAPKIWLKYDLIWYSSTVPPF